MTDIKERGYASGNYWAHCCHCGGIFRGDKRATSCLGCAKAADRIEKLEAALAGMVSIFDSGNIFPSQALQKAHAALKGDDG